jgi:Helix-turn-helix domain
MLYPTPQQIAPRLSLIYFSLVVCVHSPRAFVGLLKSAHRAAVSICLRRCTQGESSLCQLEMPNTPKAAQRQPNSMNTLKSLDELEHQLHPLAVKEAARIFGESIDKFYRRIRRNEIPGVFRDKPRGRIKICPKEFVPWIRSQFCHVNGNNNGGKEGKVA